MDTDKVARECEAARQALDHAKRERNYKAANIAASRLGKAWEELAKLQKRQRRG